MGHYHYKDLLGYQKAYALAIKYRSRETSLVYDK